MLGCFGLYRLSDQEPYRVESDSLKSALLHSDCSETEGFWLTGQIFECMALRCLWFHWHREASELDWQNALERGYVYLDQRVQTPADTERTLIPGQRYALYKPQHQEGPVDIGWKLLWQNHELMAVHKPARLPVSRTTRNLYNTLISLVRRETQYTDAHLLHRLDAETSGLILLAKNSHCDRKWKKRLDRLLVRKRYLALVWGKPDWYEYDCQCYLAEDSGSSIRSRVFCLTEEQVNSESHWIKPKLSHTRFRHIQTGEFQNTDISLIECELLTGRRHQIRTQLAWLGYPIIGDKIYSNDGFFYLKRLEQDLSADDYARLGAAHQLLHAASVELNVYGESIKIQDSHLPDDWRITQPA